MPLPLDTLLFWIGLAITVAGLYVFITGRSSSDQDKKGSNRFEAFGIKIDVSNPSLLLVILGVVMMMAPKFIPQTQQLEDSDAIAEVSETRQKTVVGQSQRVTENKQVAPKPNVQSLETPVEQVLTHRPGVIAPETVAAEKKAPTEQPVPTTQVITGKSQEQIKTPVRTAQPKPIASPKPPVSHPEKTLPENKPHRPHAVAPETVAAEKKAPTEQPVPTTQVITGKSQEQIKTPVRTAQPKPNASPSKPPVSHPEKTLPANKPPEPAAKPLLLVFARAETSQKAGMRSDTIKSYTKKLGNELARQVNIVFSGELDVRYQTAKGIDSALRRGGEQIYGSLCRDYNADLLFLGNLTIPFSMSDIESTYWPDLEMHLVNCGNQTNRKRTVTHLNPKNGDAFIFQQAISRASENFLFNSRRILR